MTYLQAIALKLQLIDFMVITNILMAKNIESYILSEYAETQIALTLSPELVKILFSAVQDDCSGSGKGSLF